MATSSSLNHAYKLVWSQVHNAWVAVSEITKGKGKTKSQKAAAILSSALFAGFTGFAGFAGFAGFSSFALAEPTGGVVTSGSGTISQSGTTTTINQSSQTLNLNWNTFNVGSKETVNFIQPSATALAVNRILDTNGSRIMGNINANGQVWLINPNGVYFGSSATINVGSLLASTLNPLSNTTDTTQVFGNGGTGSVTNAGTINAADGGYVALIANTVSNTGTITANTGTVALGAGSQVSVTFADNQLLSLTVDKSTLNNLAENKGLLQANGGVVLLSAGAKDSLLASVVNNDGVIEANTVEHQAGKIILTSNHGMVNTGQLKATGDVGGQISIDTKNLIDAGQYDVSGVSQGGDINIQASNHIEQTTSATLNANASNGQAGNITITAGSDAYLSSTLSANGNGAQGQGGNIKVTAPDLSLAGATVTATGTTQGGQVSIGGGWQGKDASMTNANTTKVVASQIDVSATNAGKASKGNAGTAVIWSEEETTFNGSIKATGGKTAGNGGMVEVSSHDTLNFGGTVDASASNGNKGTLLLDPKNIEIIADVTQSYSLLNLADPTPSDSESFGSGSIFELKSNGVSINRILVVSTSDDNIETNTGAVRLYDSQTGALISTLSGSSANDSVGSGGITTLSNGNYLVISALWDNGTSATNAGAVTWGSGTAGVSGTIDASNSLVGSSANDAIGSAVTGITTLSNGNYVVSSALWDNGTSATNAGAVTWGSGTAGVSGTIDASNSLVGSSANDSLGSTGISIFALSNGNYVVRSIAWDNGTSATDAGAVTWGSGTAGVNGTIDASNSLVGSSTGDSVGNSGLTTLSNGNYLVRSGFWDNGTSATNAGAVTWGSGTAGVNGTIDASNSLVGSSTGDSVGNSGLTTLSNGNYVVATFTWDNGTSATNAGAVTWGSGTAGVSGTIDASNSLVGLRANDSVGNYGVIALSNGNYVVRSTSWDNGTSATDAGAVTWGSGTAGVKGTIDASNSLVGSSRNDVVGISEVRALSNGNYVVSSNSWDNGTSATNAGAVTWGNGTTGVSGTVSASNSLVGSSANDSVGNNGITTLSNGNYLVRSITWDYGTSATNAGALTWGSGTAGVSGMVSASNSLVGSSANDSVGNLGVIDLSNGNYLVRSALWDNGTSAINAGAVTWGSGTAGVKGTIDASNSLVGSSTDDSVGNGGLTTLSNGNYLVSSIAWDNGTSATNAGALTWGSGTAGVKGTIDASNSLVGSSANDSIGSSTIDTLSNGNYVVRSASWDNGTSATNAGAVTWGSGTAGVSGTIDASNSLVGLRAGDSVGNFGVTALSNGNYVVRSTLWDNGTSATDAGAVTWGSGTAGVKGTIDASNSLVGSSTGDSVGNFGVTALSNGNYLVSSTSWDNGTSATNAGAVTWGSGTAGVNGTIDASNSLVGSTGDSVGNAGITTLSNGNYLVRSGSWDNGTSATDAGAVTWGSGTTGVSGTVSASNSLVGSSANDATGSTIITLSNGNYVVRSAFWDNGTSAINAGAVTWGSGTAGVSGVISASNSLVGLRANDSVGNVGVTALSNGNYVVRSTVWDNGTSATNAGAVTWGNGTTGVSGTVSASNSLVGSSANDSVGSGFVTELSDGRVLIGSPDWDNGTITNAGRVDIMGPGSSSSSSSGTPEALGSNTFSDSSTASNQIRVGSITAILNAGTNVVLQANNDITLATALTVDNATGNGGSLTLQAGRSVLLNGNITTDNGDLTVIGNEFASNGVIDAERDAGAAKIQMASGTSVDVGTGKATFILRAGTGLTNNEADKVVLQTVTANTVDVTNTKAGVELGAINATTLNVTSGGAVTQTAAATVSGTTTVDAGSNAVTLDNAGNDFNSIGLTAGAASVTDKNAVVLNAITAASLNVKAGGAVTQTAAATVSGTTTVDAGTNAVTLDNANNDFNSIGLTAGAASVTDKNAVVLNAITAASLNVKAGGAVTQTAAATVSGTTTVDAGTNAVTLDNANNDFNSIGLTAGAASVTDKNAVVLNAITAASLNVKAGGAVTQTAAATVSGTTTVDAGTNAVTLDNANNDFNSIGLTAGAASVTDKNAVVLNAITAASLNVKAGGAVTQTAAATVSGTTTVDAGTNAVTLDNANNDFNSIGLTAGAASVTDKNAVVLNAITAASLNVKAGGAVTQTAAATVSGTTTVDAGTNAVTLDNANNDFNSIGLTAGAASVTDKNAVVLNAITAASLNVKAGGAVTQTAAATVSGTTTVDAGTNAVTLDNANNDFNSIGLTAGAASVTDKNAVVLNAITAASLNVKAGGAVTQTAAATVSGTTTVDAGTNAVTLDNANNDFNSIGLTAGAASVTDKNAVVLNAITAASLNVKAGGAVTQTAAATVSGITTVDAGTNAVTLDNANNDFNSIGLTAGAASVTDKNAVVLNAITAASLNVKAGGAVTQTAAATVSGTTTVDAGTNAVTLDNANNDFNSIGLTAGAASVTDKNAVVLNAITAASLNVKAGGAVTQTAAATVSGTTTVDAGTNAVTLDNANNDFNSIGLTAGAASVTDKNAVVLNAITAASLNVKAGGAVTQTAAATVSGTTTVDAGTNAVTLDNANNDFNSIGLTAGAASVTDKNAVVLNAITAASLNVKAGGAVTQTAAATVSGTTTVDAGTNAVTLDNANNDFNSIGLTAGAASVTDKNAVVLNAITAASLNVKAGGAVTQTAAATVSGITTVDAGTNAVTLDNANNDFNSIGLTAGAASVTDKNAVVLNAITAASLNVKAGGAVTQTAAATVSGTTTVDAGTNAVTLDNANNDFNSIGLTAGAASVTDKNAVVLNAITAASLNVKAGGAVTQTAAATVSGTTTVDAGTNAVTLDNANNDFNSIGLTAGAASVTDKNAVVLNAITAASLNVKAGGAVTQTAAATVSGTATVDAGKKDVTLDNPGNSFGNLVILNGGQGSQDSTTTSANNAINVARAGLPNNNIPPADLIVNNINTNDSGANAGGVQGNNTSNNGDDTPPPVIQVHGYGLGNSGKVNIINGGVNVGKPLGGNSEE